MADIGMSYSHLDSALAQRVRSAFVAVGPSVWMDEISDGSGGVEAAEDIALPWGQAHWDVITSEFAAANVVVILDTPRWRASRYCQDEYQFLLQWGKWLEFIDATFGDIDQQHLEARVTAITSLLKNRRALTSAHSRIVASARAGGSAPRRRIERFLWRAEERDARSVLATTPEESGLHITDGVARQAQATVERAAAAKRRLRQAGVTATAVLAVLAVTGVAALFFARAGFRAAATSSARSQALELASQSQHETDTLKSVNLARRADSLSHSTRSTEALNVALANDARMRTVVVGPQEFYGGVWASQSPRLIGYSVDKLVAIDANADSAGVTVAVPDGVQIGTVAVSADGKFAAFVTRQGRHLELANLTSGHITDTSTAAVSAVATGDGQDVFWSTDSGELGHTTFSRLAGGAQPSAEALPTAALAISVTPDRKLIDYAGADGRLHTASYGGALHETAAVDITTPDHIADASHQAAAAIKRCGDNLFGAYAGRIAIKGTVFSVLNGAPDVDDSRPFAEMATPVCNSDQTAWYTSVVEGGPRPFKGSSPAPYTPTGSARYLAVTDPSNSRAAVLTSDGKLYMFAAARTASAGRRWGDRVAVHRHQRVHDHCRRPRCQHRLG